MPAVVIATSDAAVAATAHELTAANINKWRIVLIGVGTTTRGALHLVARFGRSKTSVAPPREPEADEPQWVLLQGETVSREWVASAAANTLALLPFRFPTLHPIFRRRHHAPRTLHPLVVYRGEKSLSHPAMHRLVASALRTSTLFAALTFPYAAVAQEEEARRTPPPEIPDFSNLDDFLVTPKNSVSLGFRSIGRARVTFGNLGSVSSNHNATDTTSEVARTYDNGNVGLDARRDDDGNKLADDGRTNTWNINHPSQISADESSVSFSKYSSTSEGASISAASKPSVGVDVEFSREWGTFGRMRGDDKRAFTWGALWGVGLSDVNAKTRGTIYGTLHTLTDTYSLLGSAPPTLSPVDADGNGHYDRDANGNLIYSGYTAPSSTTETLTNADGTTTTYTVDNTILLANRPDERTESTKPGAAEIQGFWQVHGAYFTLRAGPWLRWQPVERFAFRFSGGATFSMLGLQMRYDERLVVPDASLIQDLDETTTHSYGIGGLFGAFDAEWWLTERTGFFGSAYYESYSRDVQLGVGGREADIKFSGGVGVRAGLSYRF